MAAGKNRAHGGEVKRRVTGVTFNRFITRSLFDYRRRCHHPASLSLPLNPVLFAGTAPDQASSFAFLARSHHPD